MMILHALIFFISVYFAIYKTHIFAHSTMYYRLLICILTSYVVMVITIVTSHAEADGDQNPDKKTENIGVCFNNLQRKA